MEKLLNLTDGWDEIINDKARRERIDAFHAKRRKAKHDRLCVKAGVCGLLSIASALMGLTGAMTDWIALPAAIVLAAACSFICGRIYGLKK